MSTEKTTSSWGDTFSKVIKNLFWLFLLLQVATVFFSNMWHSIGDVTSNKVNVGALSITGQVMDSSSFVRQLHQLMKDDSIKGIMIKVDSPGGAAGSGQVLYQEISRCKKPVVVYTENMCASTAYYASVAADAIVASGTSLVGSIGALISVPNVKGLLDTIHVQINDIHSGDYKTIGSSTNIFTDADRQYLKLITDDSYNQFIQDVAQERGLDLGKHFDWANGRIFTGKQAYELGLIDEVGSYSDALQTMRELLKTEEELNIIKPPQPSRLMKFLAGSDYDDTDGSSLGAWCGRFMRSALVSFSSSIS